jgi:hypothetical protein
MANRKRRIRQYEMFGRPVNAPEAVQRVAGDRLDPPSSCRFCKGTVKLINNAELYGREYGWPLTTAASAVAPGSARTPAQIFRLARSRMKRLRRPGKKRTPLSIRSGGAKPRGIALRLTRHWHARWAFGLPTSRGSTPMSVAASSGCASPALWSRKDRLCNP